jgi:hypothetical protein
VTDERPEIIVSIEPGSTEGDAVAAVRRGWRRYQLARREREARDLAAADMDARADLAELHARLGTWDKVADAVNGALDEVDASMLDRRTPWVRRPTTRELVDRFGAWARLRIHGDLGNVSVRQLQRWANEEPSKSPGLRYATDADFDDSDWTSPEAPEWGVEDDGHR